MKFIIASQLLLKNLQSVGSIIGPNKVMPIVEENVLFTIENKKLTLTSTDLETTMVATFELSDNEGEGSVGIPYKIVVDTLKSLPDVPVIFNIGDDYSIEMIGDDANYNLVGVEPDEFPLPKKIENSSSFEINSKILVTAINKTAFATGQPDVRPVMAGIKCELKNDSFTFVATDAHRLVRYQNNSVQPGLEASFILPKKPLMAIKNIFSTLDCNVRIDFSDNNVAFSIDGLYIFSKFVEGKFPTYEAAIPKNNNNILQVERLPLLQRLRSISPYANQSTHQIRIKINENSMNLTAEDIDNSSKATTSLNCNFENVSGEEFFEIGFSSKFLQEILASLETNEVIFKFASSNVAGLIFPLVDEANSTNNEDILILIMPVMLGDR